MAPTIFSDGPFRFFFFSREEPRMHVHVQTGDGEAKFWLEPEIGLAQNSGLAQHEVHAIEKLIRQRKDELTNAWRTHFGS